MATLVSPTINPHILMLQSQIENAVDEVQWLVIAPDDPQAMRALSRALASESMAVLNWPADSVFAHEAYLVEAIQWAVREKEIANIVLLGYSYGSGMTSHEPSERHLRWSRGGILAGAHQAIERNRQAQERFSQQAAELLENSCIGDYITKGKVDLYLLLYRAIDGTFLSYDIDSGTLRPLIKDPYRGVDRPVLGRVAEQQDAPSCASLSKSR